jgi:hypothetical protein
VKVIVCCLLLICCGCEELALQPPKPTTARAPIKQAAIPPECPWKRVPPMDLPREFRCANYAGGSCMHASLISVLRWQGLDSIADYWRHNYYGGAAVTDLARIGERLGLDYAFTMQGDVSFLEWASRTRRGAAIHYKPNHACTFCGFVGDQAVVLDNNSPRRLEYIDRDQFIRSWKYYGGMALTPVYRPPPARPWI